MKYKYYLYHQSAYHRPYIMSILVPVSSLYWNVHTVYVYYEYILHTHVSMHVLLHVCVRPCAWLFLLHSGDCPNSFVRRGGCAKAGLYIRARCLHSPKYLSEPLWNVLFIKYQGHDSLWYWHSASRLLQFCCEYLGRKLSSQQEIRNSWHTGSS